MIQLIVGE